MEYLVEELGLEAITRESMDLLDEDNIFIRSRDGKCIMRIEPLLEGARYWLISDSWGTGDWRTSSSPVYVKTLSRAFQDFYSFCSSFGCGETLWSTNYELMWRYHCPRGKSEYTVTVAEYLEDRYDCKKHYSQSDWLGKYFNVDR